MTYSYEALDRTHCIINSVQANLTEYKFYNDCEEYRELVDKACELLTDAYQVAGKAYNDEIWEIAK